MLKDGHYLYWFGRFDTLGSQMELMKEIGFKIKNQLIWVKNNHGTGDLLCAYAGRYECIVYAIKKETKKTKMLPLKELNGKKRHNDVLFFDKVKAKELRHDHQKPIDLLSFLIEKSTDKNDIVLDPFAGSGSTVLASIALNRKIIGIELNKDIYAETKNEINKF